MAYLAPPPPPLEVEYGEDRPDRADGAPSGVVPLGGAPLGGTPAGVPLGIYPITYDQPTAPPPAADDAACATVPYEITMCLPPGAPGAGVQLNHRERSQAWAEANLQPGQAVVLLLGPGLRLGGVVPVTDDIGALLRQITLQPAHGIIVAGRVSSDRAVALHNMIGPIAAMFQLPILDSVFVGGG